MFYERGHLNSPIRCQCFSGKWIYDVNWITVAHSAEASLDRAVKDVGFDLTDKWRPWPLHLERVP